MKKILLILIITGAFILALCNQSILVDRSVSNILFTPNIFVSAASVKKASVIEDYHVNSYYRNLNDSVRIYHVITKGVEPLLRVTSAGWEIKYKNMTSETVLNYLENNNLDLITFLNEGENLFDGKTRIFWNNHIRQYLKGSYLKSNDSFFITYEYPSSYYDPYDESRSSKEELKEPMPKNRFKKDLKDFFIGAPH